MCTVKVGDGGPKETQLKQILLSTRQERNNKKVGGMNSNVPLHNRDAIIYIYSNSILHRELGV